MAFCEVPLPGDLTPSFLTRLATCSPVAPRYCSGRYGEPSHSATWRPDTVLSDRSRYLPTGWGTLARADAWQLAANMLRVLSGPLWLSARSWKTNAPDCDLMRGQLLLPKR
jgi:hypothetical protein